jgi:hypothetical protein
MRIRGGAGLGDAMYIRPVAEHFVRAGERVTVCNDFAEVFIGSGVHVEPFDRFNIDVLAHYTVGKRDPTTNQWQDVCKSAGIAEIPLRFDWTVRNCSLVDSIVSDAAGRYIIVVHGGRVPMGRTDGFGKELLPGKSAFDAALAALGDDCFLLRVGKGSDLYPLDVDVDLNGGTSVSDLLDIATVCDGVVGQCSFAIPLAEVFDKPLLCVWASGGLSASHPYIRQITPQKVLSKATSRFVMDDWTTEKIQEVARTFRAKPLEAAA